jgi:hypothetical protein
MRRANRFTVLLIVLGAVLVAGVQATGEQQTGNVPRTVVALWDDPKGVVGPTTLAKVMPIAVASIPKDPGSKGLQLTLEIVDLTPFKDPAQPRMNLKNAINIQVKQYDKTVTPKAIDPGQPRDVVEFKGNLVVWLSKEFFHYEGAAYYFRPDGSGGGSWRLLGDKPDPKDAPVVLVSRTESEDYIILVFAAWLPNDLLIAFDG